MAGCRICGCPTSRRLCRQCEIEERAEERARARKELETDEEENDDEEPLATDGGCQTAQTTTHRAEAERRARQAARSLDYWSREARLDLVELVQEETPVRFGCSRPILPRSVEVSSGPAYRLVCRDCPFEGHSTGEDAQARLDRAQAVHQAAFGHETTVERVDASSGAAPSTGGVDR